MADIPYKVTNIRHEKGYRNDGSTGGTYHVDITHASGVQTSFSVPEGPNVAHEAHAAAMQQVNQANELANLPAGQMTK